MWHFLCQPDTKFGTTATQRCPLTLQLTPTPPPAAACRIPCRGGAATEWWSAHRTMACLCPSMAVSLVGWRECRVYSCAAPQDFNPADLHAFLLAVMQAWRTSANVGWWLGRNPQTRSRRGRVSVLCNSRRCFCVWRTMSAMLAHLCPRSHPAVVKCRVLSADPTAKKGLKLSFVSKKKAAPAAAAGGA